MLLCTDGYVKFKEFTMNALKSIKIKNVKGKNEFDLTFENLHPNMINLLVAPNGFGKSTIV